MVPPPMAADSTRPLWIRSILMGRTYTCCHRSPHRTAMRDLGAYGWRRSTQGMGTSEILVKASQRRPLVNFSVVTAEAKPIQMRPETEETLEQFQLRAFQALGCVVWRSPCGKQDTCPRAAVNGTCMRRRISSHGQRPLSARREDPTPIGCVYRTATSSGGDGCGVPINPAPTSHTTCGFDPAASRHHACGHGPPTEDTSCVSRW